MNDHRAFKGANLEGVYFRGANLEGAELQGTNFLGANLDSANLRNANLSNSDLACSNLVGANLVGVNLRGAELEAADFRGAVGVITVEGLPSGSVLFYPTPDEWLIIQGCYGPVTLSEYRAMIEGDVWPMSNAAERTRRRPALLAMADMLLEHVRVNRQIVNDLAKAWND